ncbi:MAG: SAM hydrolase/SAM-dependent halogenase family protein [Candidatus Binatia bacterium]
MEARLITLLTDFGLKDPFVGIMKGVILGINPNAHIIDLSHGIPPQDLMAGALVLRHSAPFFPRGTIHVAIVDPGVGTKRRPLLVESEGNFFIGPDNGVLSLVLEENVASQIIHLSNETYHLKPTSTTFHGRDIFAPVAAYLSLGIPPQDLGTGVKGLERLPWPKVIQVDGAIQGEVVYIDNFGNLITNVYVRDLMIVQPEKLTVSVAGLMIQGLASNYTSGEGKGYAASINSWGLLEISSFKGNAHLSCGAKIGDRVYIREGQETQRQTQ